MNATSEGAARLTQFATGTRTAPATTVPEADAGAGPGTGAAAAAAAGAQQQLLAALADRAGGERWQVLADAILRDRLANEVPVDIQHQQAVRAELVNAMAHEGWNKPSADYAEAADESIQGAEAAIDRIRDHYAIHMHPYPAAEPSRDAPDLPLEADPRRSAAATESDQALRAALSGQAQPRATLPNRADSTGGSRPPSGTTRDPLERG